jgi:carboxyl-terminal processing protease
MMAALRSQTHCQKAVGFFFASVGGVVFALMPCPLSADSSSSLPGDPAFPSVMMNASHHSPEYQAHLAFFEKVYATMEKNYYHPIDRRDFKRFLKKFDLKIYGQMKSSGKSGNYIKWRSAAFLVEHLKSSDDIFSAFFPPKAAKDYEEEVLGKKIDLGIEGKLMVRGYLVVHVEPRSDAYVKGLRRKDIIFRIGGQDVVALSEDRIHDLLTPLEGSNTALEFYDFDEKISQHIEVMSQEYFKQTVFMIPVKEPGAACLQIQRFNRKTSEDMTRFMVRIIQEGVTALVIDLRGNPGGPPLAAREISSFFLPPNEEFAYFQKRDLPESRLSVPQIPERFRYSGDMAILVNEKSGSASELLTGILQSRGRAVVMGENTAGQVFLKSMFPFEDDSMVVLVTARGHYPDGRVFSFDGITPDNPVDPRRDDLPEYAARLIKHPPKGLK